MLIPSVRPSSAAPLADCPLLRWPLSPAMPFFLSLSNWLIVPPLRTHNFDAELFPNIDSWLFDQNVSLLMVAGLVRLPFIVAYLICWWLSDCCGCCCWCSANEDLLSCFIESLCTLSLWMVTRVIMRSLTLLFAERLLNLASNVSDTVSFCNEKKFASDVLLMLESVEESKKRKPNR